MNITLAIASSNKGKIAFADLDFSSIGATSQTFNKPYFNAPNPVLSSLNSLAFPNGANAFRVKGLRYYFRPYYSVLNNGDLPFEPVPGVPLPVASTPSAYVFNPSNNNTEVIGITEPVAHSYFSTASAAWLTQFYNAMVLGAANFECDFQDVLDVSEVIDYPAGIPVISGRLLLQFTEFEVEPFSKTVFTGKQTV